MQNPDEEYYRDIIYNKTCLKRSYSKADTCLKRRECFAPKCKLSVQNFITNFFFKVDAYLSLITISPKNMSTVDMFHLAFILKYVNP